jgi:drug/metabolite transporter (DMT)-like permease
MNTVNSWKTTSSGIAMIVGGIVGLVFAIKAQNLSEASIMAAVTAILGGVGLVFAKDANVTGGTDVAKNNDPDAVKASQKQ